MIVEGIRYTSVESEGGLNQMDAAVVTPLARSGDTSGAYSLFEVRDAPGGGPPLHRHSREDEAFYVLEGEYEVHSQDGLVTRAGPGTYVFVPRGTVQAYKCVGPGQGRMLVMASPGGLEVFFEALSKVDGGDFAAVAAVAAANGIEVVGPPV